MTEENKNKIEDIKRELYDPNDKAMSHQREGILHKINHDVPLAWQEEQPKQENEMRNRSKKPPMSIFKKFFIVSIIFFIGAIGYAYYRFTSNDSSVSSDKINIAVIGNSFTKGGDDLPLQIEITNNNNANLELADLIVEYPKGADDNTNDVVRLPRDSIGTIKPGENVIRNIKVKLYGEEKSVRNIKVSLEYHPEGSNAIFTKDKNYPVTISLAPLSINIDAPITAISNQSISFKITATLNTTLPDENSILQITYPNNFAFDGATPNPILGNSVWDLSALSLTNPITIEIKGRLIGQDGDEQVFHAYAGTTNGTDQSMVSVVYSSVLQKVQITKPFLDANILVNGQDQTEYAVSGGQSVNVEIDWANNLSTLIADGQIIVSLSGNVFDKSTVNPNSGFYDSINNQIIWDKNSVPQLSEINPGETGSITFSFKPASLIGLSNAVKDPQVAIDVSIKGRQPQLGSTYTDVNNFSEKIVKILTDFQIASSATYLYGSFPPKAESETDYTVSWTLSNSANNVTGAIARSALPIYVDWKGVTNGITDNVTYNKVTREVIWNIGSVAPGTGISSNREVSFIVTLKPSLTQVGSIPQLMKEIYLSGTDSFTNTLIKSVHAPITTVLSNSDGRVFQ
jgi:hypothetical protein